MSRYVEFHRMGLVPCENRKCRVRSWTLPVVKAGWPDGLCPSCRDPEDAQRVIDEYPKWVKMSKDMRESDSG